jgi:HEAT repeat protein
MFDLDPMARLRGVLRSSPQSTRDVWTLRELALSDEDGRVRAAATQRLAEAVEPHVGWWLREALWDELPSVREAAWTALARHRLPGILEHAAVTLDVEPSWWVRRAAVWTVSGLKDAAPVVALALDDPQWRVRHAATRALASHPAFVRELAQHTPSEVVREGCRFMLGEVPGSPRERPLPLDDDPAVAADRLERGVETLSLAQLVRLLADPHQTLRTAAEARLAQLEHEALARAVLPWLDEPRAEDAVTATRRLLAGLPFEGTALAREVFAREPGRGQLGWAAALLVEGGEPELVRAALDSPLEAKRGAAFLALLDEAADLPEVALSLTDRYLAGRLVAARSGGLLSLSPAPEGRVFDFNLESALAALERNEPLERRAAAGFLVERRSQLDSEVRLALAHELARDDEPDVRAMAVRLARTGGPFPFVPRGLNEIAGALKGLAEIRIDPPLIPSGVEAPLVHSSQSPQRAGTLGRADDVASRLRSRRTGAPAISINPLRVEGLTLGRAHEVPLDSARGERAASLELLLRLNLDVDPGVRSLAAEALEAWPNLGDWLTELVATEQDTDVLRAAWQWIARLSRTPLDVLAGAQATDQRVREHLAALTLAHGGESSTPAAVSKAALASRISPAAHPTWRGLGATGLQVSPLVLSGANDLNIAGFTEAAERGLNTFFWEPDATSTTRFLRLASPECQVVTGSYHSGAAPIRRDVETALRRLGRERLDVFLLFWVRSSGRLCDENLEALAQLRAEGNIATFGFSTHLREVAMEALASSRWPVVMTRLSLAHPGAEASLLPLARETGTGVLTFTSTCYGRLLRATEHTPRASARECYQFALERPGVSSAVCAPRTLVELEEALGVLEAAGLDSEREAALRAHGRAVKESSSALNHFIRHVPSTGRAAFSR